MRAMRRTVVAAAWGVSRDGEALRVWGATHLHEDDSDEVALLLSSSQALMLACEIIAMLGIVPELVPGYQGAGWCLRS
jgi:hypothetical protein